MLADGMLAECMLADGMLADGMLAECMLADGMLADGGCNKGSNKSVSVYSGGGGDSFINLFNCSFERR